MQHVPLPFDLFFLYFFNGISHLQKVGYKHPILQLLLYSLPLSRLAWKTTSSPPFLVKLNGEGRWQMKTSHLFRHTKKKQGAAVNCPPKKHLRKPFSQSHVTWYLVPYAWWKNDWWNRGPQICNPGIEVPLCGDGLEATPCMSWIKRTMRGRFPEWSTYDNKKVQNAIKRSKNNRHQFKVM